MTRSAAACRAACNAFVHTPLLQDDALVDEAAGQAAQAQTSGADMSAEVSFRIEVCH